MKLVVGVGVDIVELERIRNIRARHRFAEFFLTPFELGILKKANDPIQFLASRFAVKEATIKAFPEPLTPHEFEVRKQGKKPVLKFLNPKNERRYHAAVSLSHSTQYAAGAAVVTKRENLACEYTSVV